MVTAIPSPDSFVFSVSAGDVFAPRVALLVALPHVNILLTPSLPWCDLKTTYEKGGIVNL